MKQVFDIKEKNYRMEGFYLEQGNLNALIKVYKDDELFKEFEVPAYKIYNYPAHFSDMVVYLESQNTGIQKGDFQK